MVTISKLDYLLKVLKISGKEAAECLGVDTTTVSKWRNNRRKIPIKNGQARELSKFIIEREAQQDGQRVFDILKTIKAEIHPKSREQQIELLSLWLSEENLEPPNTLNEKVKTFTPKNGYNTNVSIFIGENGIDEALTHFFERVLKMSPGKTIYLTDYSGINWVNSDDDVNNQLRVKLCMKYFRLLAGLGHKLVIFDCDTDIYRPYRAIFRWMELYLMDMTEVWSHPPIHYSSHYTNIVVENEAALQCISNDESDGKPHGMLYTNRETVEFFAKNVESVKKRSKRLIESLPNSDILSLVEVTKQNLKLNRHIYMLNPSVTLQLIDTALLAEILEENGICAEKIKECAAASKTLKNITITNRCTAIYNLDILERFIPVDYTQDSDLSEICGSQVLLSKSHQKKILNSIMTSSAHGGSHIFFITPDYLNAVPNNLSIFVQEDAFFAAWNVRKYNKRLYCQNLDIISGFYRYIDDLKNNVPKICREKDWRDKQMNRIRELL